MGVPIPLLFVPLFVIMTTLRLGDNYMTESDDIIARFATEGGPAPAQLPTFQAYVEGPFKQLLALYKENAELKKTT